MSRIVSIDSEGNEHYPFSDWDRKPCLYLNMTGHCGNLALNCCGEKCKNPYDKSCAGYSTGLKAYTLKDSGERTEFPSGAVRDLSEGKGRFDLLPMCVLMRLAKHYEAGAKKYSDRNWEKGIFAHSFADSAFRHLVKYMDGWNDEDHLIAAIWNLCGLAWTEEKKPEYMDIPTRKEIANDRK